MANRQGSLSINSENIFPIIKKWLYSDHDIFFRELISNGCDAITKLKKLDMMGEYTLPNDFKARIDVVVNPEAKTLTFIDNGLGMTADEVSNMPTQVLDNDFGTAGYVISSDADLLAAGCTIQITAIKAVVAKSVTNAR